MVAFESVTLILAQALAVTVSRRSSVATRLNTTQALATPKAARDLDDYTIVPLEYTGTIGDDGETIYVTGTVEVWLSLQH